MTLEDYRLRAGLSRTDLAQRLDVSHTAVHYWETCENGISRKMRKRLCNIYNITQDELAAALAESLAKKQERELETHEINA